MPFVEAVSDAVQSLCEHVLLPRRIPFGAKFGDGGIGNAVESRRLIAGAVRTRRILILILILVRTGAAELIGDAPAGEVKESGFEAAVGGIIDKIRKTARDADGGFLNDLFGFVRSQSRFCGEMAN